MEVFESLGCFKSNIWDETCQNEVIHGSMSSGTSDLEVDDIDIKLEVGSYENINSNESIEDIIDDHSYSQNLNNNIFEMSNKLENFSNNLDSDIYSDTISQILSDHNILNIQNMEDDIPDTVEIGWSPAASPRQSDQTLWPPLPKTLKLNGGSRHDRPPGLVNPIRSSTTPIHHRRDGSAHNGSAGAPYNNHNFGRRNKARRQAEEPVKNGPSGRGAVASALDFVNRERLQNFARIHSAFTHKNFVGATSASSIHDPMSNAAAAVGEEVISGLAGGLNRDRLAFEPVDGEDPDLGSLSPISLDSSTNSSSHNSNGYGNVNMLTAHQQNQLRMSLGGSLTFSPDRDSHQILLSRYISQQPKISSSSSNGPLFLTDEEKRTLIAEGYPVPKRLPLSKSEEKSLKKIRRKIKNKISAQESRRKKKEYIEALENKVQAYANDNSLLKSKLKNVESSNLSLQNQLKKLTNLASSLYKSVSTQTNPGSCFVILFSFLVAAGLIIPRDVNNGDQDGNDASSPSDLYQTVNKQPRVLHWETCDNFKYFAPSHSNSFAGGDEDEEQQGFGQHNGIGGGMAKAFSDFIAGLTTTKDIAAANGLSLEPFAFDGKEFMNLGRDDGGGPVNHHAMVVGNEEVVTSLPGSSSPPLPLPPDGDDVQSFHVNHSGSGADDGFLSSAAAASLDYHGSGVDYFFEKPVPNDPAFGGNGNVWNTLLELDGMLVGSLAAPKDSVSGLAVPRELETSGIRGGQQRSATVFA